VSFLYEVNKLEWNEIVRRPIVKVIGKIINTAYIIFLNESIKDA